ncbi:MAG: hypothetical protein H8E73_04825 [Planctomycetes bacterium]|nr:hypothetical protein [Planctomycetota bacterium]
MSDRIEAADDFRQNLLEVDILLQEAGTSGDNKSKLAVMNKSAVLLLMGKFEAFLESVVADYVYKVEGIGATASQLPDYLLLQHSIETVKFLEEKVNKGSLKEAKLLLKDLGCLWTEVASCDSLKIDCAFDYGKHGEGAIGKLFKRIGFDELFNRVQIHDDSGDYLGQEPAIVDVAGAVNSLTHIRNNILHEDKSPSLTTTWVRQHCKLLARFADAIVKVLQKSLDEIKTFGNPNGDVAGE